MAVLLCAGHVHDVLTVDATVGSFRLLVVYLLALASAVLYGAADFAGGLTTRRAGTVAGVPVSGGRAWSFWRSSCRCCRKLRHRDQTCSGAPAPDSRAESEWRSCIARWPGADGGGRPDDRGCRRLGPGPGRDAPRRAATLLGLAGITLAISPSSSSARYVPARRPTQTAAGGSGVRTLLGRRNRRWFRVS